MKKESLNDVIRADALTGLAELKDERALPIAIEWTQRGKSNPVRGAATAQLGRLGQLSDQREGRGVRPARRAAAGRLAARAPERRSPRSPS